MTHETPHNHLKDPDRIAALRSTALLDTQAEESFDRLTRLAVRLTNAPVALVSLVDANRQFFKSCIGLPEPWNTRRETPLSHSFCQHNRIAGVPLVIEDAREDAQFKNNLAIRDLSVVAYLGIPLVTIDGYVIGSFCVIDSQPRSWTEEEIEIVTDLSASAMAQISLRIEINRKKMRQEERAVQAIMENIPGFAFIKDIDLNYVTANQTFCDLLKIPYDQIRGKTDFDIFPPDLAEKYIADDRKVIESGKPLFVEEETTNMNEEGRRFVVATRKHPWQDENGRVIGIYGLGFDISEVKWAEQALQESEFFSNSLIEAVPIPVFFKDREGKYKRVNKSFEAFFGAPREDLIGKSVYDINPPELAKRYHAKDNELFEQGGTQVYEEKIESKHGRLHDVVFHKAATRSVDGKIDGIIGTIFDITDQKKQQEEMRTILRAVEETSASVVITDTNGTIEYINPSFSRITGYEKSEVIGKNPRILQSGHQSPELYQVLWQTIIAGETWQGELINKKKNGELYWESASISPVKDPDGIVTHYVGIKDDITKLKKAESALRESEKQRETILKTTIEGFWLIDNDAVTLEVNQSMCDILEKPRHEIIGRSIFDFFDQTNSEIIRQELKKREKGVASTYEAKFTAANGKAVTCLFNANPLYDNDDKKIGSFAMITNISDQKRIEDDLKQAKQEADIANRAKSEFLANMSHELRTPLNGVIGFTQVLERQLSGKLSEKQLKFFDTIKQSGDHLLAMVNDILDLSKIEAGKIEIELKLFDLGDMLERSPSVIQAVAHKKKLQVETAIQPGLGWLNGDETRLKQVIYNLLSNAVKFTPSGKKIGLNAVAENDDFVITVWDEGEGIPEDYLEKIFTPFEQVKGSRIAKESGTGLGLAISKRILDLHGGTITVTSRLSEGSRFIITLPGRIVVDDPAEADKIEETINYAPAPTGQSVILLVEDNKANRELIEAALEGYQLDFSESGEAAIRMTSDRNYDLILMDIQLPGMDGVTAMKRIRRKSEKRIPVIALTAFAMKGDEEKYRKDGFDDYISKPIEIDVLIQKIQSMVG